MSTQQNSPGQDSASIGIGGPTSGEAGATPTHETMAETGGSGGAQQTQPSDVEAAPYQPASTESQEADADAAPEPLGAGMPATAVGRGYQDTRSAQSGRLPTGLGTPETGGNQDAGDLAPPRP